MREETPVDIPLRHIEWVVSIQLVSLARRDLRSVILFFSIDLIVSIQLVSLARRDSKMGSKSGILYSFHSISFSCEKRPEGNKKSVVVSGLVSIQLVSLARRDFWGLVADLKTSEFPFN